MRFLSLIFLISAPLFAQTTALDIIRQTLLRGVTYANLPSPATANQIAVVTDCADSTCSTGGGSTVRLMRYTGSAWAVLGDGNDGAGGGLASTDIDTSAELATILTDETGSAGGFVRATTSSTVGVVLRVGAGPTIGFGAVDLADGDAVTGVLPAANVDTAIARLASPSFTTPTLGAATGTSVAFGADPADSGAIRCSNNAACVAAEIATPGTDMTITPNTSNQWAFSHAIRAPGFILDGAGAAGLNEYAQGTAPTHELSNSVLEYAPTSVATSYDIVKPSAVGSTGVVKVAVSGTVATYSHAALVAGDLPAASDTAVGGVELATAAETTTGTDTGRAVTPDGLAGSDFGKDVIIVEVIADGTAVTTGDGKAYVPVPAKHNGWNIVAVQAHVGAAVSSSGAVNVDIARCAAVATGIRCSGTVADVLSTNITIDADEDGTETAAAAAVIDGANDDLATGQWIRIDVDGAGTGTQGLYVVITLQKP